MKNWKRVSVAVITTLLLGIFSCEEATGPAATYTVTVSGTVTRLNNNLLDSVVVILNNPFRTDTTGTDGVFQISFTSTEKNTTSGRLTFSRYGFYSDTMTIQYSSTDKDKDVGQVALRGLTSAQDSVVTNRPSARPGVIAFVSSTLPTISIRGAGSNDATNLTFEVRDSLGIPVDATNKATVNFLLVAAPDNAVSLNKTSAVTNSLGQVVVQLSSGQRSGIAQVQAFATVKKASDTTQVDTIRSPIVSVTVAGGNPVLSSFTIGSEKVNVPGLVKFNQSVAITAMVGDTFRNPVQPGTFVYFTTTGGIIEPDGKTTDNGTVSVSLRTGLPLPPGGVATITAQVGTPGAAVTGKSGDERRVDEKVMVKAIRKGRQETRTAKSAAAPQLFTKTVNVLFTGAPRVTSNDSVFVVPTLGTRQIAFTVADENGNPMSQGTSIKVTGVGFDTTGAVLSGDIEKTLPDTYDRSFTQYTVSVADKRTKNLSSNIPISITVEVTGENGNVKKTFSGLLSSAISSNGSVGSIALVDPDPDSIRVAGAGTPNSVQIQAQVLTANGQPSPNIPVNFAIVRSVDGGEYLSNTLSVTDAGGVASTILNSGVKAGLVQVQAVVKRDSLAVGSEPKNVYIRTGQLASIAVLGVSQTSLSVRGGGGTENSILVFEGRDSLGNAIDVSNQSVFTFSLVGDTAGVRISPSSAKTDPNTGRVTASLSSGTQSGIIQIRALSGSVQSPPATITVAGGFAVDSLFNFTGLKKNYSIYQDAPVPITVLIGDRYGNPVKPATPVAFTSDAGVITAAASTDASGKAAASLQIVNDKKLLGTRFVSAKTIGASGVEVRKSKSFILTGTPVIQVVGVPSDSIILFDGTATTLDFIVADSLGNPVASGHDLTVSVDGSVASQISTTGDIAFPFADSDDRIGGTRFSVIVGDLLPNGGTGGTFKVRFTVEGPTGTTTKTLQGRLLAPANIDVPPTARVPASIALISTSATDISIAGVGGIENATLTYEVRDSVGAPITIDNRAVVQFKTNFFPNTFVPGGTPPAILPTLDSTDENGRVRVSIMSGSQAGAVQIEAIINLTSPVRVIKSQPVRISINSGFADQNHFTIAPSRYNFPGLQKAFYSMPISIQAGDKYSNPVKEGTTVYFNSANGIIQTLSGMTDKNGFVTMNLYSSNPYPLNPNLASGLANGFSRVYARTIGKDSTFIADSVEILWTGAPVLTKTGGPATFTIAQGGSAGPFTFTVADYLSHPMSEATSISVSGTGLDVSGDANVVMPDTKSSGPGLTSFTISVADADPTDTNPPVVSLLTLTVTHPVYGTYKLVLATGTVD